LRLCAFAVAVVFDLFFLGGTAFFKTSRLSTSMFRFSQHLYFRIYLAVLASLALAALLIGLAWRLSYDPQRYQAHLEAFADVASDVLPPPAAPRSAQQAALDNWHRHTGAALALYGADGHAIAAAGRALPAPDVTATDSGWLRHGDGPPALALKLADNRWLVVQRVRRHHRRPFGFAEMLALIALAIALGAYPVVRRLTRRIERLQAGVEALGAGDLAARVEVHGHDEVARLAESFNRSAARIEALVAAQKTLLANASHELRSPLARIRMAVEMLRGGNAPEAGKEMVRNIAELDQLIEEILLASRLDAGKDVAEPFEEVDFTALVAEECARAGVSFDGTLAAVSGSARLLRRMVRNLLENARRYGGAPIEVTLRTSAATVELDVCDRGPGVPEAEREKIFDPFYRRSGAPERNGGVGLGLALVRQIAATHRGDVACLPRSGGGSCFRVRLPLYAAAQGGQSLPDNAGAADGFE
jgi:signal transduction histidine kinase